MNKGMNILKLIGNIAADIVIWLAEHLKTGGKK